MVEDKEYCMSSFLQFRIIADKNKTFRTGIYPNYYNLDDRNIIINSPDDIDNFIRELFEKLYPDFSVPKKIPMPRAVGQWLKNWNGPTREEFKENCIENLDGNQKWQVYCLEYFLNLIDENEKYDK